MGISKFFSGFILLLPFTVLLVLVPKVQHIELFYYHESLWFSSIIWYSGVILALLSIWALSQRITTSKIQLGIYLLFLPLVWLFVTTTNLLVFFMCYELFLLPSFFIVFLGSPNRRGVLASVYFLMWTQVGSFLVFIAIVLTFIKTSSFLFESLEGSSSTVIFLALLGFGIKIPMWPAHYWLTKTHVEAPTYFSIYLSGFLVKTALYGIWLFISSLVFWHQSVFFLIAVVGVIDSSIKMWAQVDLKKLVAYGTVQEMNLILLGFLVGTSGAVKASSLFIIAHTILSTIFFLFSDSVYKRFSSRSTSAVRGLLQTTPSLGYFLFASCLLFAGLPFTLKFVVEVYIFTQLFNTSSVLVVVTIFIANWFGIISFMKNWFTPLFGNNSHDGISDISNQELLIFSSLGFLLIGLTLISSYIL